MHGQGNKSLTQRRWHSGDFSNFSRRVLSACISVMLAVESLHAQTRDDVLNEYLSSVEECDIPTKIEECDFIISNCDSSSRVGTALKVFRHFKDSKLMGDENVAVHVADKWIIGNWKPADEDITKAKDKTTSNSTLPDSTLYAIRNYADFNRASLLRAQAPLLPETGLVSFPVQKPTILWFYDTDCAKCRVEAVKLEDFLRRRSDCGLIAFYIGDDAVKWKDFRSSHFEGIADVRHLSDPSDATDFRHKYSVTATPRMFLIDTEGIIIGRMLDTESLELLLNERTSREKAAVMELFYKLIPLRGEDAKNALEYLIDTRILCRNSAFNTSEDSLLVVNFAQIQKELLSRARPGTKIAPIKVRGSLNGHKLGTYRLDRLSRALGRLHPRHTSATRKEEREINGKTVIVFHTAGCHQCEVELKAAKSMNINVLEVNIDEIQKDDPETLSHLLDSFDLTSLPLLIETDRNGTIIRRYFSLTGNQ